VSADALQPLRDAIDDAGSSEPAAFARAARNAVARAILTASLAPDTAVAGAEHEPPEAEMSELLGPAVGAELAALYRGGDGWTSRAIDLLEPLNELAHAKR
jgi:hypothetical protein